MSDELKVNLAKGLEKLTRDLGVTPSRDVEIMKDRLEAVIDYMVHEVDASEATRHAQALMDALTRNVPLLAALEGSPALRRVKALVDERWKKRGLAHPFTGQMPPRAEWKRHYCINMMIVDSLAKAVDLDRLEADL